MARQQVLGGTAVDLAQREADVVVDARGGFVQQLARVAAQIGLETTAVRGVSAREPKAWNAADELQPGAVLARKRDRLVNDLEIALAVKCDDDTHHGRGLHEVRITRSGDAVQVATGTSRTAIALETGVLLISAVASSATSTLHSGKYDAAQPRAVG